MSLLRMSTWRGWLMGVTVAAAFCVGGLVDGPAPEAPVSPLAAVLPFYRVEAPAWCQEDMPCWVGSAADGRTDAELMAAAAAGAR